MTLPKITKAEAEELTARHIEETWEAASLEDPLWIVRSVGKRFTAICITSQSDDEANAKKIVADHNACLGMADPGAEIAQLRQDKAELVEVVEGLLYYGDIHTVMGVSLTSGTHKEWIKRAQAALAKAREES